MNKHKDKKCIVNFLNLSIYTSITLSLLLVIETFHIYSENNNNLSFRHLNVYHYMCYRILFLFASLSYWITYILYKIKNIPEK